MKRNSILFLTILLFVNSNILGQDYDPRIVIKERILSIKKYSYQTGHKKELLRAYYFDSKGNLTEMYDHAWTTPTIKYKYDDRNNLIQKDCYKPNGAVNEYHKWTYGRDQKIETHISLYSWQKTETTDYFTYNELGQLVNVIEKDIEGDTIKIDSFTYNLDGFLQSLRFQNLKASIDRTDGFNKCASIVLDPFNNTMLSYKINYIDSCKAKQTLNFLSEIVDTLENGDYIKTTNYIGKTFIVKRNINGIIISRESLFFDQNNLLDQSKILYYNDQGQVIEEKNFFSGRNMWTCSQNTSKPIDEYFHFKTEYYSNGLIKRVDSFDTKGRRTQSSEYEIEY